MRRGDGKYYKFSSEWPCSNCLCLPVFQINAAHLHIYKLLSFEGTGLAHRGWHLSSTPDPSCSSETQGEVRNLPRAVGILSSRGSTPACAALSLEATSIAGQQQGTSGTGHFFFPSMPHSEPERGSCGLPGWTREPSSWAWTKLPPKAAELSHCEEAVEPFAGVWTPSL